MAAPRVNHGVKMNQMVMFYFERFINNKQCNSFKENVSYYDRTLDFAIIM